MFEALVLVCASMELENCMVVEDTRGPYATIELCMSRTTEMSAALLAFDEDQFIMGARCDPVEDPKHQFSAT
tara:strand:- start:8077 stop:8292 length:216 start_codon:yes stop_codon:yes gene_type:complete